MGCGDGQVVSMFAFSPKILVQILLKSKILFLKIFVKITEINENEAGNWLFYKEMKERDILPLKNTLNAKKVGDSVTRWLDYFDQYLAITKQLNFAKLRTKFSKVGLKFCQTLDSDQNI